MIIARARGLTTAAALFAAIATAAVAGGSHGGHAHGERAVPEGVTAPTVALLATPDTKDGFNLQIKVSDFAFSPERTGEMTEAVEGHIHLYINDTKVGRVYGEWMHLPASLFAEGENMVRATLNDNMHSGWTVDGQIVEASLMIMVSGGDHAAAGHGDGHGHGHGHDAAKSN